MNFCSTAVQRSKEKEKRFFEENFQFDLNPKKIKSERRTLMNDTESPTNSIIRVA